MTNHQLADLWSTSPTYAQSFQPEAEIANTLDLLNLHHAESLIDNGCGNGAFAIAAARQYPHCKVFACDALSSAIDECVSRAGSLVQSNLTAAVAPAASLPLPDNSADRALSRFVLHHLSDPEAMFHEMRRVLQPDSLFLLQAPCNSWHPAMADTLRQVFHAMDSTHPRYYYQPHSIRESMEECGFIIESAELQKFLLPDVTTAMAEIILKLRAEMDLNLQPVGDNKYTIELTWVRILARL